MHGAAGGLLGAMALAPYALRVGTPSLLALCGAGAAVGVPYGLLFRRLDQDVTTALGWGLSYGFLWWGLGPLTLLPLLGGRDVQWAATEAAGAFGALIALLLYGACLGLAFHLLQARHRGPRPVTAAPEPVVASFGLLLTVVLTVLIVLAGV
jgi:hypothetical protein